MAKRRRRKNLEQLGTFLGKTLKRHKITIPVKDPALISAWNNAVGALIAAQARPHRIKNDTLFVHVSTSTWMQQLHFMKHEILDKVKSHFTSHTIRDIRFTIGEISPMSSDHENTAATEETHSLRKRDLRLISSSLETIKDEELKQIVKRVMTRELINRRLRER